MSGSSHDADEDRTWRVIETLGPVFSHGGFKNLYLCLAKDAIIALPLGIWQTLKAGVAAGFGNIGGMQRAYAKGAEVEGERVLKDEGDPSWRRYLVEDLESVFMKKPWFGANEIRLQRKGAKADVYGIGDRSQTKACRSALFTLYEQLYSDKGFSNPPEKLEP